MTDSRESSLKIKAENVVIGDVSSREHGDRFLLCLIPSDDVLCGAS